MKKTWWAAVGLLGMMSVVGVYPFWETADGYSVPGLQVAGTDIGGLSKHELQTVLESKNRLLKERTMYITHDRYRYPLTAEDTGLRVDTEKSVREILAYGRRGSLWTQWRERVWSRFSRPEIAPQVVYDAARVDAWVTDFQKAVAQPAQNAALDWSADGRVDVIEERPFFRFSAEQLTQRIRQALPMLGRDEIALNPEEVTLPTVTKDMLQGIDSLLGQYITYFAEDGNRAANIRRAAAAVDQQVLQPGEWMSFNTVTGLRTEGQGYLPAPVFINGKLEPDFGGGVCQVSSTLFNSALLSGLDIMERTSHFAPVGYVEIGRDATVADHYLDLVIANSYGHPIGIVTRAGEGTLQIAVLGHHTDRPGTVNLEQVEYRVIPHDTIKRVVQGTSDVPAREDGHDGYQVAWTRSVSWDDGQTKTDSFASYYEPVATTVFISAKDRQDGKQAGGQHTTAANRAADKSADDGQGVAKEE